MAKTLGIITIQPHRICHEAPLLFRCLTRCRQVLELNPERVNVPKGAKTAYSCFNLRTDALSLHVIWIACEISVTTTIEHEVQNVANCMEAGYQEIAFICRSKRRLSHIEKRVEDQWDEAHRKGLLPGRFSFHAPRKSTFPTHPRFQAQAANRPSFRLPSRCARKERAQHMLRELAASMNRSQKSQQN